jgi:hypothetical protein
MVLGHPRPAAESPQRERHHHSGGGGASTNGATSVADALLARVSQPALKKQQRRGGLSRFYATKSQSFSSIHDLLTVSAPYSRAAALLLSKRPSFDSEHDDGGGGGGGSSVSTMTCSASWGALDGSVRSGAFGGEGGASALAQQQAASPMMQQQRCGSISEGELSDYSGFDSDGGGGRGAPGRAPSSPRQRRQRGGGGGGGGGYGVVPSLARDMSAAASSPADELCRALQAASMSPPRPRHML